MKKAVVLLLIVALITGSLMAPALAGKKKKKKVEREAQGTYAAPATVVGNCTQQDGIGCMTIQSGAKEKYITAATVTDALGQAVSISVEADLDGDSSTETDYGAFCGELTEPIQIDPGAAVIFWVGRPDVVVTTACAPGTATEGTLDVTFSNLP